MTKEEAKNCLAIIYERSRKGERAYHNKYQDAFDMAIEALNGQQWIPCSERLPEINHFMYDVEPFSDEVLVAIKNEYGAEDIRIACLEQRHGWNLERDDRFRWRVIAWMPLPEPYEVESDE